MDEAITMLYSWEHECALSFFQRVEDCIGAGGLFLLRWGSGAARLRCQALLNALRVGPKMLSGPMRSKPCIMLSCVRSVSIWMTKSQTLTIFTRHALKGTVSKKYSKPVSAMGLRVERSFLTVKLETMNYGLLI